MLNLGKDWCVLYRVIPLLSYHFIRDLSTIFAFVCTSPVKVLFIPARSGRLAWLWGPRKWTPSIDKLTGNHRDRRSWEGLVNCATPCHDAEVLELYCSNSRRARELQPRVTTSSNHYSIFNIWWDDTSDSSFSWSFHASHWVLKRSLSDDLLNLLIVYLTECD